MKNIRFKKLNRKNVLDIVQNTFVSKKIPLVVILGNHRIHLVPKNRKYFVLKPNEEYIFKIKEWKNSELYVQFDNSMFPVETKFVCENSISNFLVFDLPEINFKIRCFLNECIHSKSLNKQIDINKKMENLNRELSYLLLSKLKQISSIFKNINRQISFKFQNI